MEHAEVLTRFSGGKLGTVAEATRELQEPPFASEETSGSVWYAWKPARSGLANVSLVNIEGVRAHLDCFSGPHVSDLVRHASSSSIGEDTLNLSFDAQLDREYFIRVALESAQEQTFGLTWRSAEVPINDHFHEAISLAGIKGTIVGTTDHASNEPFESTFDSSSSFTRSVWYKWTAPAPGKAVFELFTEPEGKPESNFEIYAGEDSQSLWRVSQYGSRKAVVACVEGETYHVMVATGSSVNSYDFRLDWEMPTHGIALGDLNRGIHRSRSYRPVPLLL
jgi:hypothetical protein